MKTFKITLMAIAASSCATLAAPVHAQAGTQFIGQVSAFGANFCPRGWADASGSLLPISSNTALFAIIGTTYGGDGRTTLGLPDLRGRRPISQGNGPGIGSYFLGSRGGTNGFTLFQANLPSHSHTGTVQASTANGDTNLPQRNSFAAAPAGENIYFDAGGTTNAMAANTLRISNEGGGQPVNKLSPYQTVKWCIAINGIFPSRN